MKKILVITCMLFSLNAFSKTLTKDFQTTGLKYNNQKKYYEVTFVLMAGIYKANDQFFKCLQKSLESKKSAQVTYEAMGLKITGCKN